MQEKHKETAGPTTTTISAFAFRRGDW